MTTLPNTTLTFLHNFDFLMYKKPFIQKEHSKWKRSTDCIINLLEFVKKIYPFE